MILASERRYADSHPAPRQRTLRRTGSTAGPAARSRAWCVPASGDAGRGRANHRARRAPVSRTACR